MTSEAMRIVIDLDALEFDDLEVILEMATLADDEGEKMATGDVLRLVKMIKRAIVSDTSGLRLTDWQQVISAFNDQVSTMFNPVDEATGKN